MFQPSPLRQTSWHKVKHLWLGLFKQHDFSNYIFTAKICITVIKMFVTYNIYCVCSGGDVISGTVFLTSGNYGTSEGGYFLKGRNNSTDKFLV